MKKAYTAEELRMMPLEKLIKITENMERTNESPRKLPLDPTDPRDVEWYRNDESYDIVSNISK